MSEHECGSPLVCVCPALSVFVCSRVHVFTLSITNGPSFVRRTPPPLFSHGSLSIPPSQVKNSVHRNHAFFTVVTKNRSLDLEVVGRGIPGREDSDVDMEVNIHAITHTHTHTHTHSTKPPACHTYLPLPLPTNHRPTRSLNPLRPLRPLTPPLLPHLFPQGEDPE
jgi:hypothetical protein